MKLPDKNIRVGLLMIISQLLIIGFTMYWLIGQFGQEREKLLINLNKNYKAAYETGLDSLLVKQYIDPVLGDSTASYFNFRQPRGKIFMTDSFRLDSKGDSLSRQGISGNSIVTINLSTAEDTGSQANDFEIKRLEKEMLLRSVKLIVQHVDDSSMMHFSALHEFEKEIDSVLFVSEFESRIEREGIAVKTVWVTESLLSAKAKSEDNKLIIGGWTEAVPSISIEKYRTYLVGQILPQILFSLILIILSASAFIISYLSLRKQTLLNELRSSFISNISHELKTPVSTVKIAIEAIRNFDLSKDAKVADEYLGMASKEIKRLELLITKILDNTIIEQDSSILRFEKVNLPKIISGAIDSLTPKIIDAGGLVRFAPADDIEIEMDPLYMQGVILNLIDNSLKYGNGKPEVDITLSAGKGHAIIVVSDNGPGIPEQFLKKVFDKFFRIPTSDVHNVKGYGLGLSFASLIIEMHNGTIEVKNNEKGCSFTIKIPLSRS